MPIQMLPPEVIAQIAAGEVVERPASVIKELVENALDAGATQVSVEIKSGGVDLIRVTDNGSGIPADEVELAFERHATSKITRLEDLSGIITLGFRGEALASIAAVAEVELFTQARGETSGTLVKLANGTINSRQSQARARGTTITVKYLFRKVPARLKFLKSTATESSHAANIITQYALAYPEVQFTLTVEGKQTVHTPGSNRLVDAIAEIYGIAAAKEMLEVNNEETRWESGVTKTMKVSGMVGIPTVSRTSRSYLSFFVNRRWISSRLLTRAVEEAYQGLLMQDRHPVAVINLTISPAEVDANIHPTKTEVKFASESAVFATVQKAVRRTLVQQTPVPRIEEVVPGYRGVPSPLPAFWSKKEMETPGVTAPVVQAQLKTLPILRVIGQAARNYIVAEGDDGLYIIDQHAAHERIRYEQIKEQLSKHAIEVQGLLEPAAFEASATQASLLKQHYADLVGFGFSLEPFGERTYLVRTVPAILYDRDWLAVLREILDGYDSGDKTTWEERIIDSMACHSAIRAGQTLTDDEMRELIRLLEQANIPRTCPHGRPTMLHLTLAQLGKEFGRTG